MFYKVTYYELYTLARLFNSRWQNCSTVAGTIIQQSLARFFNNHWHDSSRVTGTIPQQWLARLFNSHWQDSSTVMGKIFPFFYAGRILQQSRSRVEESCHASGIRHMILAFAIWQAVFSVLKSFVPVCRIIWSRFISRKVGFTWSVIQLIFASENERTLTRCLCLILLVSR